MCARRVEEAEEVDPSTDFLSLSVRLNRPSDHYRQARTVNNAYDPPPRRRNVTPQQFASLFIQDPVTTTLSSFSKVANFVWSPHEEYENVIDLMSSRHESKPEHKHFKSPPPALPLITCSNPQPRLPPLGQNDLDVLPTPSCESILEHVFRGGIASNEQRRVVWPIILGLTRDLKNCEWKEREKLFDLYECQWTQITADQESRFLSYRERKSILERDVVRCDRTHSFFSESSGNLEKLRHLLMAYIMHDFDTGYVQGMTDLASPLLYVFDGDVKKAFWCFVQVMHYFKNNFEMSQATIAFQLKMLFKLIRITDPCFAQYLTSKESDNCYFAFRWIICLFKREFMKGKSDEYDDCLRLWETIWAATAIIEAHKRRENHEMNQKKGHEATCEKTEESNESDEVRYKLEETVEQETVAEAAFDDIESRRSCSREHLTDAQLFVLCICLSIIRRERDLIMAKEFDACETLKHFNTLNLTNDLNNILLHASTIWTWLKVDGGEDLLHSTDDKHDQRHDSCGDADFDLLQDDFMLVNTMNV